MKYHPIGDMKCPFCGQLNLVYKRPGLERGCLSLRRGVGRLRAHHRPSPPQRRYPLRCGRGAEFRTRGAVESLHAKYAARAVRIC